MSNTLQHGVKQKHHTLCSHIAHLTTYLISFSFALLLGSSLSAQTNNALNFDGINDNVSLPNTLASALTGSWSAPKTQMTIEYWFKGTSLKSAVRFQAGGTGEFIVSGWFNKHIISTDGGTNGVNIGAAATDGNWHHVAVTWKKGTINGFKSYLDGQLVDQRNSANVNLPIIYSGASLGSYDGFDEFLNGSLDEVRIWNIVRTQQEIVDNMNCELTGGEAGLLAYYRLNAGVAAGNNAGVTSAVNATASAYNGTLNNFALSGTTSNWVAGRVVSASVSIAADPSNSIAAGESVTFTATPTNGGSSPSYQWYKNGNPIGGANAATYTDATLADGDEIMAELTSSESCADPNSGTSNTITMSVSGVVPVELLYFTGKATNNGNLLTWATATELNNEGFEIQRSTDGRSFAKIGWVSGQGTTQEQQTYAFTDDAIQPNTIYYYRLKQMDFDGTTEYSKITTVTLKDDKHFGVSEAFPNPTSGTTTFQLNLPTDSDVQMMVFDLSGRLVKAHTAASTAGSSLLELNTTDLPQGQYFVKLQLGSAVEYRKVVVQ